ncbi:phage protein NinX family protein [Burkholderia ambifaria]|uniref:phage protein NinX family protein n=1 Tax=Burkholderia ambifaria TaxID=152480 RepID=UPI001BA266C8|nr:phage protein NinX family protein [Burkholderia ambifaria]MBR7929417.1 DUF2591 domain-containing protein [Burkholderia ambifaria]
MKVSELSGALLDYWVARSYKYPNIQLVPGRRSNCWFVKDPEHGPRYVAYICEKNISATVRAQKKTLEWSACRFSPSEDWNDGGPVIEKNKIVLIPAIGDGGAWMAQTLTGNGHTQFGDTALIAAMRAYVASKFGDEVPDDKVPS